MEVSCCRRSLCFSFFFLLATLYAFAEKGESSRVLVHTLNYISHDYQYAVQNGQVINKQEYKEAQEFGQSAIRYFNECSGSWSKEDSTAIRSLVYRLDSLIAKQASFSIISPLAIDAKNKVVAASGLKIIPTQYPNLDNGKILYKTDCARCHGETGLGDGPDGKILDPKPRDFFDKDRMSSISPFYAFNTIRLGVEGTGMKPHETLEDNEVWDLAFYILSLRYQKYKGDAAIQGIYEQGKLDSLSLELIATSSDADLLKTSFAGKNPEKDLAAIRLNQPVKSNSAFIDNSLKYLDGALAMYKQGKFKEAGQMATLSYLEGIEPVEMQIKASDPALMSELEARMGTLRKMMAEQRPASEVEDSVNAAKLTIKAATEILANREYSFWLALSMALSILLREGLEAFLIIMVILSILKAAQLKNASAYVHGGWIVAVLVGILLWLAGGTLLKQQKMNAELLEGIISFLAVIMLLYVGFWLHGHSEMNKWRQYVKRLMDGAVSKGSLFGLGAVSFFVVFREVFESVLFLSALDIESGGKQTNAIMLGVIAAFVLVIILAVIVLQFSTRLPISKLFKVSSVVMGALAVVLSGKGVHALQEVGILPIHGMPMLRFELIGLFPTIETCVAQLAVLVLVLVMLNYNSAPKKK